MPRVGFKITKITLLNISFLKFLVLFKFEYITNEFARYDESITFTSC